MKAIIDGRLPGTNELIGANRSGWKVGAGQKKSYTTYCAACIRKSLHGKSVIPPFRMVDIYITFYEPNGKRDPDNIVGGLKYILDGAVASGAIPDDSQKYIRNIHSHIEVDAKNPRVVVEFKQARVRRK